MPIYKFRCHDTGQTFEVRQRIRDYDPAAVRSPFTGSANVSRLIEAVAIAAPSAGVPSTTQLDALGNQDPKALARSMRQLADNSNQTTSAQFNEVVKNLEAGKRPSEMKQSGMTSD